MSYVIMKTIDIKNKLKKIGLRTTDKHFGKNIKAKQDQYIIYLNNCHLYDDYELIKTRIEYVLTDFCVDAISPVRYKYGNGEAVELWCFVTMKNQLELA